MAPKKQLSKGGRAGGGELLQDDSVNLFLFFHFALEIFFNCMSYIICFVRRISVYTTFSPFGSQSRRWGAARTPPGSSHVGWRRCDPGPVSGVYKATQNETNKQIRPLQAGLSSVLIVVRSAVHLVGPKRSTEVKQHDFQELYRLFGYQTLK